MTLILRIRNRELTFLEHTMKKWVKGFDTNIVKLRLIYYILRLSNIETFQILRVGFRVDRIGLILKAQSF